MNLTLTLVGDLKAIMDQAILESKRAVTAGVDEAGKGLQTNWRAQILGAGLRQRLANSVRRQTYPKGGVSMNAAALVWTKAATIVGAFERGVTIQPSNGLFLAIPLPAAGMKSIGKKRITPRGWEARTGLKLKFIHRRTKPSLLVAEGRINSKGRAVASKSKTGRGLATIPIFLLVKQVRLPKKLDLASAAQSAQAALPSLIVAKWKDQP